MQTNLNYIPALTGLRAVACLSVIGFHTHVPGFGGGFLGVDVFFVLSGYLCARILLADGVELDRAVLSRFLARRVRRVMPSALLAASVITLWALLHEGSVDQLRYLLTVVTASQNVVVGYWDDPTWLSHFWTISTEIQFYFCAAMLAYLLRYRPRVQIAILFMALYVSSTVLRVDYLDPVADWWVIYASPLYHATGLCLGAAIGALNLRVTRYANAAALAGALGLVLSVAMLSYKDAFGIAAGPVFAELATAALIISLAGGGRGWVNRLLSAGWMQHLGVLSFGMYLWHYPFARYLRDEVPAGLAALVTLVVSLLLAQLSYRLVETRFHRMSTRPLLLTPPSHGARQAGGLAAH